MDTVYFLQAISTKVILEFLILKDFLFFKKRSSAYELPDEPVVLNKIVENKRCLGVDRLFVQQR